MLFNLLLVVTELPQHIVTFGLEIKQIIFTKLLIRNQLTLLSKSMKGYDVCDFMLYQ